MSNAFAAEFDAVAVEAFADAGLADSATYTAPGGSPQPCMVLIDRDIASSGDFVPTNARSALVTIFRADIAQPVARAVIAVGADRYTLQEPVVSDESRTQWMCRHE